jgi:hypothetical protein
MVADKGLEREPQRRAAQEAIAEAARLPFPKTHLGAVAKALLRVLQQHGLGQALAYLQMRIGSARGPTPFDVLARHLDRWLLTATGATGRTALAALATRDSRFYREATEQAWLFLRALSAALEESS